ncbi:hypothetical protein FRC15_011232 [Serendipita sp. 397]|nr:hypothetical protein FRC15_011232 [Serendipita sp. 397]
MKGRELVEEFLYWYFDSFLIPLLRTTFYATESSIFRNRILFFRHDDWKTLCKPLMDKICSERFVKVPEVPLLPLLGQISDSCTQDMIKNKDRQLGHSSVRLLPKETGARLIVNLGKRPVSKGIASRYYGSVNDILQTALHILTYEKHNQSQIHRASVNSHSGIYFKLKDFKNANRLPNGLLPKLYFVKMDVHACFDSIEQGKLLDIIRRTLTEKRYMLQKYTQTYRSRDRVKRNFTRRAFADDDHQHFLSIATDLATSLRHAVFTDQVVHTFEERNELLALIEEHISSHIVEIGGNFYKQKVGIPQGSVISTILCNFFYEDLESSSRFDFMRGPAQLLLRYIDDYFFVSTSLENAKQFLAMMNEGRSANVDNPFQITQLRQVTQSMVALFQRRRRKPTLVERKLKGIFPLRRQSIGAACS